MCQIVETDKPGNRVQLFPRQDRSKQPFGISHIRGCTYMSMTWTQIAENNKLVDEGKNHLSEEHPKLMQPLLREKVFFVHLE